MADVAFAAGFASVRQFNDTVREVYGVPPTTLRTEAERRAAPAAGTVVLRLPYRPPFDAAGLLAFFGTRAVEGVDTVDGTVYRRTMRLPRGPATVALDLAGARAPRTRRANPHVLATLRMSDPRDLAPAVARLRRLLDLDADPQAVDTALAADPTLAASIAATPGMRLPGTVDPEETALRAVLGQQVSVAAARTATARLAVALGERLPAELAAGGPDLLFPTPAAVAEHGAEVLRGPARRTATVLGLAAALADGDLVLDAGRDPAGFRADLTALPGIGPWTAGYLAIRVLGDPDELLPGDLAVRRGAEALGLTDVIYHATRWAPWRSYAALHLWRAGTTTIRRSA
jgi:AraC family transcriptional regulator of adaptative response / DNA-3-methyladenine glycosylase II